MALMFIGTTIWASSTIGFALIVVGERRYYAWRHGEQWLDQFDAACEAIDRAVVATARKAAERRRIRRLPLGPRL